MSRAREIADRDLAATELILDADNDTSITADTDDRIDFKVGGSDAVHILSTGQVAIGSTTAPVSDAQLVLSGDGSTDSSPFVEFVNTSASNDETVGGFLSVIGTDSVAEITTRRESANDDAYIFFGTQATGGSLTERMRIDSNGFINHIFTSDNSTTAEGLFINNRQNSTGNNASLILSNDSGGRKKAAIAHIDTGSYGAGDLVFALDGADSGSLHLTNDEKMRLKSSNGLLYIPSAYSVTTSSAANMYVQSDGAFYRSTSSRRYKNTIEDATHGLAELLKLRSVTYKGNNDGDFIFGGLIAEEVHDAGLTEFVQYNDDDEPDALSYGNMVSLCIKAIQEQQEQIKTLETSNADLIKRIEALEKTYL